MHWFSSNSRTRFRLSFNENIQSKFQEDLQQVRHLCNLLSDGIQLEISIDTQVSRLLLEETDGNLQYLIRLQQAEAMQSRLDNRTIVDSVQQVVSQQALSQQQNLEKTLSDVIKGCLKGVVADHRAQLRNELIGTPMFSLLEQAVERYSHEASKTLEIHHLSSGERS